MQDLDEFTVTEAARTQMARAVHGVDAAGRGFVCEDCAGGARGFGGGDAGFEMEVR